jgi:hypothetical protein
MSNERMQDQEEFQQTTQASGAATQASAQAASRKLEERLENPEFFAQLRNIDIDSDEYPWVEDRLGPLQSGAHLIANRSEDYENETRWLDKNRAERLVSEREPGRLCRGKTLEIAQGVHKNPRKTAPEPNTPDQRRVMRDALEAVTNFKSLGIDTAGLSSVTEATAVSRVEKGEKESQSRKEKVANFL